MWKWFSLFKKKQDLFTKPNTEFKNSLLKLCGYPIRNLRLFEEAFTLKSGNGQKKHFNFERLEFLGDAVIGSIVSGYLVANYPKSNEGFLTKMKSKLVNRNSLNAIGEELKLTSFILNPDSNISLSRHISGDLFEALIGAVYRDSDYKTCQKLVLKFLLSKGKLSEAEKRIVSYKSLLLEKAQKEKLKLQFLTSENETNPNGDGHFRGSVWVADQMICEASGRSKKRALELAAENAYQLLVNNKLVDNKGVNLEGEIIES